MSDTRTSVPSHLLLDGAPIFIAYLDSQECYRYANARYDELFGGQGAVTGRQLREVVGEKVYASLREHLRRVLTGEPVEFRQWYAFPNGATRFFQVAYRPHIEGDDVRGFTVYGLDTTEAHQAEDALKESERLFRSVFDNAAAGIVLVGLDGRVLAANQYVCDLVGYPHEELVGMNRLEFGHADDAKEVSAAIQRLLSGEEDRVDLERRYFHRDGTLIWAQTSVSLVRDQQGEPLYLVGVLTDSTERMQAQQAVVDNERLYRSLFENAAVGMARVGLDGRWLEVNGAMCRLLGYSREEVLQLSFMDITHPDDLEDSRGALQRFLADEIESTEMDKRYLRSDGSELWARVTVGAVKDDEGALQNFVTVMEDITARKEAERALQALNEALEQRVAERTKELTTVNQELDAFNYSVSHDLKAPLRSLSGFSQALLQDYGDDLDPAGHDYLRRIASSASRMGELLDGLLTLSNYSRSRVQAHALNLSEMAKEIARSLEQEYPGRRVKFEVEEGIVVHADRQLLQVLLANLLSNAWKYTRKQSDARVSIESRHQDGRLVVSVRDNGVGFDSRYVDKLFAPFRRLHGNDEFEGQGIGLATVKRIVHKHGGEVWAEGAVDGGATFYFTLPGG